MIKQTPRNDNRLKRHLRIRQTLAGTALKPRLNVFRSGKQIYAQVINDDLGVTLCSASSLGLKLPNGGNVEAAKAVGTLVAERAIALNITEIVFDRGGYQYHGRVQALADAAREAGLKF